MKTEAKTILAWWHLGVITVADVKQWADAAILAVDDPYTLPEWLMTLSLDGPLADLGEDAPRRRPLPFLEAFHAIVETTDPGDPDAVRAFARWAADEAMGEDLSHREVNVGYAIEHAEAFNEGTDPLEIARQALLEFKPRCTAISSRLPWVSS